MSNNFKNTLESWLLEGLSSNILKSVKAFSFNLFQHKKPRPQGVVRVQRFHRLNSWYTVSSG